MLSNFYVNLCCQKILPCRQYIFMNLYILKEIKSQRILLVVLESRNIGEKPETVYSFFKILPLQIFHTQTSYFNLPKDTTYTCLSICCTFYPWKEKEYALQFSTKTLMREFDSDLSGFLFGHVKKLILRITLCKA